MSWSDTCADMNLDIVEYRLGTRETKRTPFRTSANDINHFGRVCWIIGRYLSNAMSR